MIKLFLYQRCFIFLNPQAHYIRFQCIIPSTGNKCNEPSIDYGAIGSTNLPEREQEIKTRFQNSLLYIYDFEDIDILEKPRNLLPFGAIKCEAKNRIYFDPSIYDYQFKKPRKFASEQRAKQNNNNNNNQPIATPLARKPPPPVVENDIVMADIQQQPQQPVVQYQQQRQEQPRPAPEINQQHQPIVYVEQIQGPTKFLFIEDLPRQRDHASRGIVPIFRQFENNSNPQNNSNFQSNSQNYDNYPQQNQYNHPKKMETTNANLNTQSNYYPRQPQYNHGQQMQPVVTSNVNRRQIQNNKNVKKRKPISSDSESDDGFDLMALHEEAYGDVVAKENTPRWRVLYKQTGKAVWTDKADWTLNFYLIKLNFKADWTLNSVASVRCSSS
jgi:hypothetical protein